MQLYTEQDTRENNAGIRRLAIGLGVFAVLMMAAIVASRLGKLKWLSITLTLLWGATTIFLWGLKLAPRLAYRKYLDYVCNGSTRTETGVVTGLVENGAFRDGLYFSTLMINVDPKLQPEGERLYHMDRNKPRPALEVGDTAAITSRGNNLTAWEKVAGA